MYFYGFRKRVLILGSGYVVPPVVEYLTENEADNIYIVIGSNQVEEAEKLSKKYPRCSTAALDAVKDKNKLRNLISESDIIIR